MNMTNKKLIQNFQESDINKVWDELQTRFSFDIKSWKNKFNEFLSSQPRNSTVEDIFLVFGNRRINPILNQILCRNELYPTFNNFVEYVLKKRNT